MKNILQSKILVVSFWWRSTYKQLGDTKDGTIGGELESETSKQLLQGRQMSGNKLFHWKEEQQAADED
jgi:hypothetical protein